MTPLTPNPSPTLESGATATLIVGEGGRAEGQERRAESEKRRAS